DDSRAADPRRADRPDDRRRPHRGRDGAVRRRAESQGTLAAVSFLAIALVGSGGGPGKQEAPRVSSTGSDPDAARRAKMVETQIAARGVRDPRVLAAMRKVPRHLFVDPGARGEAYEDHPVPIGNNQTISQPYIVALMTELLELPPHARVL